VGQRVLARCDRIGVAGDAGEVSNVGRHKGKDAGREEGDDTSCEGKGYAEWPRKVLHPAFRKHEIMIATPPRAILRSVRPLMPRARPERYT
jgi:hypothetical protein